MELTKSQAAGRIPVIIFRIEGDIDGSTYRDLIAHGQQAAGAGATAFLLDLSQTRFISSAGIVALHTLVKLARGEKHEDDESGWESLRAIGRERAGGKQAHVKLLNPQPRIVSVLDTTGFLEYFEIFTDETKAIVSF